MPVAGIVNVKKGEDYDVYIGRGSFGSTKWGNPYKVNVHYPRKKCIEMYEVTLITRILMTKEVTYEDLLSLSGKILGCFCRPKICHGDIIAKYVTLAESTTKADFITACEKIADNLTANDISSYRKDSPIFKLAVFRSSVSGN